MAQAFMPPRKLVQRHWHHQSKRHRSARALPLTMRKQPETRLRGRGAEVVIKSRRTRRKVRPRRRNLRPRTPTPQAPARRRALLRASPRRLEGEAAAARRVVAKLRLRRIARSGDAQVRLHHPAATPRRRGRRAASRSRPHRHRRHPRRTRLRAARLLARRAASGKSRGAAPHPRAKRPRPGLARERRHRGGAGQCSAAALTMASCRAGWAAQPKALEDVRVLCADASASELPALHAWTTCI
mmetsp:Transcript_8375/g.15722  ORF Transcript_8375/g.15722 Transcript_8375/m.15722 type:complete len:242 (+) Transcript_8375:434-1159(+)